MCTIIFIMHMLNCVVNATPMLTETDDNIPPQKSLSVFTKKKASLRRRLH